MPVEIRECRWLCLSAHCAVLCPSEVSRTGLKVMIHTREVRGWTQRHFLSGKSGWLFCLNSGSQNSITSVRLFPAAVTGMNYFI